MRSLSCSALLVTVTIVSPVSGYADRLTNQVKEAVQRSTLDQQGTKPFHLKATVAPSFERDIGSGRTGEVEIWWVSPTHWKREVRSPDFHQIEVMDAARDWEKTEGDYFPEWLRETAIELVQPVPSLDNVLTQVKTAEMRRIGPMMHISWMTPNGTSYSLALQDSTGLLLYAGGLGWGGEFKDYKNFHGRMIAWTINVGDPQVTAKITTLEDFKDSQPGFFETATKDGDLQPLRTVLIEETLLRKNLLPMQPVSWPAVQDGPLEGNITTEIVVDREGKVREMGSVVSENQGVDNAGAKAIAAMRFKPFIVDGIPVQVLSQVRVPFRTTRPAGVESFDSARTYFERARRMSFPAAAASAPYLLRAEFEAKWSGGTVEKGQYEDTWLSGSQWRREVWFEKSHYARSQNGSKTYQLAEGHYAPLLRAVMKILEPIPAIDTFVESDWRIKRDVVNEDPAVRVLKGYESPEGKLDPATATGYWFDKNGLLLKTYFDGIETQRSDFVDFAGIRIATKLMSVKTGN